MTGTLRVQRLVMAPGAAFVSGVFTGELRDADGALVGVDSRRATVPVDLVEEDGALAPVVRALSLDLLGMQVDVPAFSIDPAVVLPSGSEDVPGSGPRVPATRPGPRR